MIERGRHIEHVRDYTTETKAPWEMQYHGFGDRERYERDYAVQSRQRDFNEWTQGHFVNDRENPYQTDPDAPFAWIRAYQLGGRSLVWGRQCYRWSDLDFEANQRDGHGIDWPIRYRDLAPWYDHVEGFIGVSGSGEGLPQLPDGVFQPPMALERASRRTPSEAIEASMPDRKLIIGRVANLTAAARRAARPASTAASAAAAARTAPTSARRARRCRRPVPPAASRCSTDQVVERIDVRSDDAARHRRARVRYAHAQRPRRIRRAWSSCAPAPSTASACCCARRARSIPMASPTAAACSAATSWITPTGSRPSGRCPGSTAHTTFGNRPTGIIVPRFRNVTTRDARFLRGYSFQGGAFQRSWTRGQGAAGLGAEFKAQLRGPGPWMFAFVAFAECLPRAENRITLDAQAKDAAGLPQLRIRLQYGENERAALERQPAPRRRR